MAPRRAKVNKFDYKKLNANDVICPICRSILIKPITLPCSHGFCSSCFEATTENANLVCPLCGVRIGSWLRTATKSKKLINETFWQAIQDSFPLQVRNKLKGIDRKAYNVNDAKNAKSLGRNLKKDETLIEKLKECKKIEKEIVSAVPMTGLVNTLSKSHNQTIPLNPEKIAKANLVFNNFATKAYTCRILCQNVDIKDAQKNNESLTLIQKKNKRIQKITESEISSDRSNSIESECLYFKPIDYRHNPPSEGLAPIKVPTRKPNVNSNAKILAPCGQNQINMNYLESAFARLFSPVLSEENKKIEAEDTSITPMKRKLEKSDNKPKKKLKSNHKPNESQSSQSKKESTGDKKLPSLCDNKGSYGVENINVSLNNSNNVKKSRKLFNEEDVKRSLQEKADFELATKLQQTFNQSAKYSTRSAVLKRMTATKQLNIGGIMTPFEVK